MATPKKGRASGLTTEASTGRNLRDMSILELLLAMNDEDQKVARAIRKTIRAGVLAKLIAVIVIKLAAGGRLFLLGAGTSGRLCIVDASEIPPTFGVIAMIIGLMAGGDRAIRNAVEGAEDNRTRAWALLRRRKVTDKDVVIGVTASGGAPWVMGALERCKENGIVTGCIVCNKKTKMAALVDYPIEVIVGPEFITGSTRLKSGSAQKMTLNMISTIVMIMLGYVEGDRMWDCQPTNAKLMIRVTEMFIEETGLSREAAQALILAQPKGQRSVRQMLAVYKKSL